MEPFEAALFAKETGASIVVVMHCESEKFPTDVEKVKKEFDNAKLNWKFLSAGETIEV